MMTIEELKPHSHGASDDSAKSELVAFVADGQRDRPAQWASVERLKYYCVNLRRAELADLARCEFVMTR